jgi:hypothetical protein
VYYLLHVGESTHTVLLDVGHGGILGQFAGGGGRHPYRESLDRRPVDVGHGAAVPRRQPRPMAVGRRHGVGGVVRHVSLTM